MSSCPCSNRINDFHYQTLFFVNKSQHKYWLVDDEMMLRKLLCKNVLVVFSTDDGERPTISYNGGLSKNPVVIEKATVLRLFQQLKADKFSGPDDIRLRITKALSDVIAEPLTMERLNKQSGLLSGE